MSEKAVEQVLSVAYSGKPVIVVTHVPYNSVVDKSLNDVSRTAWQDRNLTWGKETQYTPDEVTEKWMNLVYDQNSPVKIVLAGHLHFSWDGMISEKVHEHIFAHAYNGNIGLITVDGKETQE